MHMHILRRGNAVSQTRLQGFANTVAGGTLDERGARRVEVELVREWFVSLRIEEARQGQVQFTVERLARSHVHIDGLAQRPRYCLSCTTASQKRHLWSEGPSTRERRSK